MKIVVDTNIVFSAIISDKGKIGQLLLNKPADIRFYAPYFLLTELDIHTNKIIQLTGYSMPEYKQIRGFVTKNILFTMPADVSTGSQNISHQMLKDIDEKEIPFLALNLEIDGFLWTGDKKLIKGLQNKNYVNIVTTNMLYTKFFGL